MNATLEAKTDRVRRHTAEATVNQIDAVTRRNVTEHGSRPAEIGRRVSELEKEWDMERTLEANASILALTGAALGTWVSKKWFFLTGTVLGFLFQHATTGWCPPVPVFRKLGVRTQNEIDQERFALKALRGEFYDGAARPDIDAALQAVSQVETLSEGGREPDRVRRYTSKNQRQRIDESMARRVRLYAQQSREVISERIIELRREWSIERYLQINVAAVGLSTAALAVTKNRNWGIATCAGLAFFLFHATEGFDPPMPALRRMGVRSRAEINREIYALKILRGDFDQAQSGNNQEQRVATALAAVGL